MVEELHVAQANLRLADGWKLLTVVPGYEHHHAQAVACYVLGRPAEHKRSSSDAESASGGESGSGFMNDSNQPEVDS